MVIDDISGRVTVTLTMREAKICQTKEGVELLFTPVIETLLELRLDLFKVLPALPDESPC